jgi:hypothetical protein
MFSIDLSLDICNIYITVLSCVRCDISFTYYHVYYLIPLGILWPWGCHIL